MAKLREDEHGNLFFYCPGCKERHTIDRAWSFNEDLEHPTFSPSYLLKSGHYASSYNGKDCWCTYNAKHPDDPAPFTCTICHSFITDGRIQFLADSTHHLAGQTVDMEDIKPR